MSLRSVGKQLLQTSPSPLLLGTTQASVSLWVQVHPSGNVTAPGGVEVFGDAGGKLSVTLAGTGQLALRWSSNDGQSNATSSCNLVLTPETSYHIAATWQPGSQRYYVNGVSVQPDNKIGSIGILNDLSSHPFRLGSDQAGADVTVGEPTLWIGHVLTPQEVIGLRDRRATPSAVAAPFIALIYSLAGADGVAAKVGDPGLADSSTNGLNLTTVLGTPPAYSAAALAYSPVPLIGDARVAPSGKSIVLTFQDGANNLSNITSVASPSEVQQVKLSGLPAGSSFKLSLGGVATAPIVVDASLPDKCGTWTFPTIAGHSYRICRSHDSNFYVASSYGYEVIDGTTVLLRFTESPQSPDPATAFSDPAALTLAGPAITFIPFPSNVTASGATLKVRVTGSTDGSVWQDVLRVDDLTDSTIAYYDDQDPISPGVPYYVPGPSTSFQRDVANGAYYKGTDSLIYGGSGVYGRYKVTGGAAALQSALEALPSIGVGNVAVTDRSGDGTGTYEIKGVGTLTNKPFAVLASSDAAAVVSEITHGGQSATVSINGGPAIACPDTFYYDQAIAKAMIFIPQPSPLVMTTFPNDLETRFSGGWVGSQDDATLRSRALFTNDPTATGTIDFLKVTPGTYEFGAYWLASVTNYFGRIYTPGTAISFSAVDQDGTVLASAVINQTVAPADYTDLGVGWKVVVSGITLTRPRSKISLVISGTGLSTTADVIAVLHAAQLRRTSTDPVTVIPPGGSATLTVPAGVYVTAAGPVPAITAQAITPPSATAISPAFIASPKTARIGYNVTANAYYAHAISFSNLSYQAGWGLDVPVIAEDINGYPTKIAAAGAHALVGGGAPLSGMPRGNNPIPSGRYTLLWDGDPSLTLDSFNSVATSATEVGTPSLTGTNNRRTFNVQTAKNLAYSPFISLNITGTLDPADGKYFVNIRNVRVYPPDPADLTGQTAWVNPPKFHPSYIAKFQGASCLRFMDALSTIGNSRAGLAGFKQDSHCSRSSLQRHVTSPVATIGNPTVARFFAPNTKVVQVTTKIPHSFFDREFVHLVGCGTATFSDGSTINLADSNRIIKVIDSTRFLVLLDDGAGPATMTNTLAVGSVEADQGTPWSISDVIDLVIATRVTDLWYNCPSSIDLNPNGGAYQEFAYLAAHLPAGVKVHVEFGNECWNMYSPQYTVCHNYNTVIHNGGTYDYGPYYADQQKALHELAQAAFTAAGRPNDIIYTYGGFAVAADRTAAIMNQAKINGARVDELAVAPYWNNKPTTGLTANNLDIGTRLSVNQSVDCLEFNAEFGGYEKYFTDHRVPLDAAGYTTAKLTTYEVAPENVVVYEPGYNGPPNNYVGFYPLHFAIKRHPRMYGITSRLLQKFQDAGMDLWNHYPACGGVYGFAWDAWDWWNQQPGTGDPTLDAINASDPVAMDQVKSEVAGALQSWAALVPPPVKSVPKGPLPTRNSKLRAFGLRRGMLGKAR